MAVAVAVGSAAFGRFARGVEALKQLVLTDIAGPQLTVQANSSTGAVLARVYLQQETAAMPAVNQSWCAVLVVISGQNAPAQFSAALPASLPGYVTTAFTMLPFNSYSVPLQNASGGGRVLEDFMAPNSVNLCKPCIIHVSVSTPAVWLTWPALLSLRPSLRGAAQQ